MQLFPGSSTHFLSIRSFWSDSFFIDGAGLLKYFSQTAVCPDCQKQGQSLRLREVS